MGILGSAIGGALGIGGSIFGGISASKAMKKAKRIVEGEMKDNQIGMTAAITRTLHNVQTHNASSQ